MARDGKLIVGGKYFWELHAAIIINLGGLGEGGVVKEVACGTLRAETSAFIW